MNRNSPSLKVDLLLFFAGLVLFTIALAQFGSCHGLGLEGSRFVLFTQEMLRHGITPFPTVYNQLYPDYPVTQTLLSYYFALLFGKATTLSVVLPTAIASALTLVFTYRIAALHSREWAFIAVLFELATFEFFILARAPSLDQIVTTAATFCFYVAYRNKIFSKPTPLLTLALGFIVGFLFRGAMGLVIAASVPGIFYLIAKDYKRVILVGILSLTLLSLCTGGLLLIAQHAGGTTLLKSVWNMEIYGRFNEQGERYVIYYYLVNGLANYMPTFPLALLVLFNLRKTIFNKTQSNLTLLLQGLTGWFLVILIGLSIPMDKHTRYIAALTPAIALLAALPFANLLNNIFLEKIKRYTLLILPNFAWAGLALSVSGIIYNHVATMAYDVNFYLAAVFYLVLIGVYLFYNYKTVIIKISAGVAAILILYILIVVPIAEQFNSLRPLANKLTTWLKPTTAIIFYNIGPDSETDDIKLMAQLNRTQIPQFLYTPTSLIKVNPDSIILTQEPYFKNLPNNIKQNLHILFDDKVDGYSWVVFTPQ